jgi:hypothetical protein
MEHQQESPLDALWQEYSRAFRDFDDLTLARWMAQTLGQLQGRVWRLSHPLVGAYRLASQIAQERQIWFKRLATVPPAYTISECCRAPFLPLFTRDIKESGLICQHCSEPLVPFDDLPHDLQADVKAWAEQYGPLHQVAHWDDDQRKRSANYDEACEEAALGVEKLLAQACHNLLPRFLDHYPALIWEDQDECLDIRPEDIHLSSAA